MMIGRMERRARWPWRWVLTDLAPAIAVIAALVGVLGLSGVIWPVAVLVVLGAAYAIQLHRLTRALRGALQGESTDAQRRAATRLMPSLALRAAVGTALLVALGLPARLALAVAAAASLAIGFVHLTRQVAIVETFREG